jgi:hypothetical protein
MDQQVTDTEIKRARLLHSVLLFNFVVVHIFLFLGALTLAKVSLIPMDLIPVLSICLLSFVLWQAQRSKSMEPSWFVRCHQLLAARRARIFLLLFLITGGFTVFMLTAGVKLGMSPIAAKAIAIGLGQLPFMVTVLTLVVLEYDAEHQAKVGKIPKAAEALATQSNGN